MKNITQKVFQIVFTLFFSTSLTYGQTTINEIEDKFFSIYAKNPSKALDYAFSTNKYFEEKKLDIDTVKINLNEIITKLGNYSGYELINEKQVSTCYILKSFIVKYEKKPFRFTFLFYKPKENWKINNFKFDEYIEDEMEEALKIYRSFGFKN